MIRKYHRPIRLQEALQLIARDSPRAIPLGGGTNINSALFLHKESRPFDVVDLQLLGLDEIHKKGKLLTLGATTTLQAVVNSEHVPPALVESANLEAPLNIRNMATLAGTVVAGNGRSPLITTLLALDTELTLLPGNEKHRFGDFILDKDDLLSGKLISSFSISLDLNLAFEYISRTPKDKPIVCVALATWPSGRRRVTLGGYGRIPLLAMDGNETSGIETAVQSAYQDADDEWASAAYRRQVAVVLAKRCLATVD